MSIFHKGFKQKKTINKQTDRHMYIYIYILTLILCFNIMATFSVHQHLRYNDM